MEECEAIKELHNIRPRGGIIPQKRAEALDVAIQALEKQIPKKPKTNRIDSETIYCKCPSCNITTVLYRNCIMNYCKECGKKLDWSDEE